MKCLSGDSVSLGVPTILAICIGVLIVLVIFVIAIIKVGEFYNTARGDLSYYIHVRHCSLEGGFHIAFMYFGSH